MQLPPFVKYLLHQRRVFCPLTRVEASVVGVDDSLDSVALRRSGPSVEGEAVVDAPVDQPAEAQRDELAV